MNKSVLDKNLVLINSHYMDNNSFIVYSGNDAIIIDPSFSGSDLIASVEKGKNVVAVLLTHAHFDHCFDTAQILSKWNVLVYVHEGEKDTYYKYRYDNLTDMKTVDFSKNIKWFNTNTLSVGNFKIDIMHTPGHTAGSVVYRINNWVFTGDTLFYNSYGRTDLGNSSPIDIIKSLDRLWKSLKEEDWILPGHGKWGLFKEVTKVNYMVKELLKK